MTTLDALILLLLIEAALAVAWVQWVKARRYGAMRTKPPERPPEAKKDEGSKGPLLDPLDRA